MHAYVAGIDIGTGSTKAVAFNADGRIAFAVQKHYSATHGADGRSEQNPDEIAQAFLHCLQELAASLPAPPLAIGLSSAMHSVLAVDQNGRPLTPLMLWSDARSAGVAQSLHATAKAEALYRGTGTPLHAMSPLCKIAWLRQNTPAVFAQAAKFISVKEYIWWKLFGAYEVDHSIASATGLFSVHDLEWNDEALKEAGITAAHLSRPVPVTRFRKRPSGNLPPALDNVPFFIGASDGCLAHTGSGAGGQHTASLTIGSSGAVRVLRGEPILRYPAMPFSYRLNEAAFVCGAAVNNGGIAAEWLLKNFLRKEAIDGDAFRSLFQTLNLTPAGSEGLLFLPYLTGERAPVWDAKSSALFFGIRQHHTQAHFARAVLEGVCFAVKEVLDLLEESSMPVEAIRVSGGFARSPDWLQLLADILAKPLIGAQTADASATGAAMLCLEALGLPTHPLVQQIQEAKIIVPREHNGVYDRNFALYRRLYPLLKEAMHDLQAAYQQPAAGSQWL